jgi:Clostripain family
MTTSAEREWTIMLYTMADQSGLRGFANDTLLDISRASGYCGVKTVAQVTFHSSVVDPIRRYDFEDQVSASRKTDVQNNLQYVPCTNISPQRNLADFVNWGQSQYPARRYCVILQGHAWGVDYSMRSLNLTQQTRVSGRSENYHLILGSPRSKNHLSNKDLQNALTSGLAHGKIHLLGMDSCLMCMAEVCYQLHQCAEYTIAPEGLGPIRGWPFYPILMRLNQQPLMDPAALGAVVLDKYSLKYRNWGGDVKLTTSLCSLRHSDELMKAMQGLVLSLRNALRIKTTCSAVVRARLRCEFYRIPTYVDLHNFCRLLKREPSIRPDSSHYQACSKVERVLKGRFVEKVALQRGRTDSFGLSIYFPKWRIGGKRRPSKWKQLAWTDPMATPRTYKEAVAKVDAAYAAHEFAEESGWKVFLLEFLKARLISRWARTHQPAAPRS